MAIDSMAVSDSKEMVLLVAKFSFDEIAILIGFVGIVGVESLPCSIWVIEFHLILFFIINLFILFWLGNHHLTLSCFLDWVNWITFLSILSSNWAISFIIDWLMVGLKLSLTSWMRTPLLGFIFSFWLWLILQADFYILLGRIIVESRLAMETDVWLHVLFAFILRIISFKMGVDAFIGRFGSLRKRRTTKMAFVQLDEIMLEWRVL